MYSLEEIGDVVKAATGEKGPAEALHEDELAYDDQSGAELDPSLVREARQSEIEYFRSMNVYHKVPIEEGWR